MKRMIRCIAMTTFVALAVSAMARIIASKPARATLPALDKSINLALSDGSGYPPINKPGQPGPQSLADGSGYPPIKPASDPRPIMADGSGYPPIKKARSTPLAADGSGYPPVKKPSQPAPHSLADGSGYPPIKPTSSPRPLVADGSGYPPVKPRKSASAAATV